MPAGKGRANQKAAPLAVPEPGNDAIERKRVLNVLAQRRYRQRRKEHIRKLEAQAASGDIVPDASESDAGPDIGVPYLNGTQEMVEDELQRYAFDKCQRVATATSVDNQPLVSPPDPFACFLPSDQGLWDTSILLPSLPSTPLSMSKHSSSTESEPWSLTPQSGEKDSPRCRPATPQLQPLAALETTYSFPDEAYLEMSELTLLRGCMEIARRMNIQDIIWSLASTSPFTDPTTALAQFDGLPANLRPTWTQMTIPHHPVVDMLPWPAARDRMIKVLSQPPRFDHLAQRRLWRCSSLCMILKTAQRE